jgi:hypothetical protein
VYTEDPQLFDSFHDHALETLEVQPPQRGSSERDLSSENRS